MYLTTKSDSLASIARENCPIIETNACNFQIALWLVWWHNLKIIALAFTWYKAWLNAIFWPLIRKEFQYFNTNVEDMKMSNSVFVFSMQDWIFFAMRFWFPCTFYMTFHEQILFINYDSIILNTFYLLVETNIVISWK